MHQLEKLDYRQYGNLNLFALPVLEIVALLLIIGPSILLLKRETQITSLGTTLLMVVIINAVLQIVDMIRVGKICDGPDFSRFEDYCELIVMQSFCNVPFVIIGTFVLLIWRLGR